MSKIKFNITKNREIEKVIHNLQNIDNEYIFYYDETNNIRKLRIKEDGNFNIPSKDINKNFVLGGIVYKKDITSLDTTKLKEDLDLDKKIIDMKFKNVSKKGCDFLNCMKSEKLTIIFNWILENELNIHFSSLNILYWTIVDILDSTVIHYPNFRYDDINYFKAVLYELVKIDVQTFLKILYKYNYPNIQKHKVNKFLISIKSYVLKNKEKVIDDKKKINEHSVLILADILRNSMNKKLDFLHDNQNNEVIDRLAEFYMRPLGLFKNSHHIFDEEDDVIKYFNQFQFLDGDTDVNYFSFEDSKNNIFIQLSDIVIGILGRYSEFINNLELCQIQNIKDSLNPIQKENLIKLFELCRNAELTSKAFVHYATSIINIEKERLLSLEFLD